MTQNEGIKHVEDVVKSVYLLEDPHIIKLLMALAISHWLPSDPVWTFIVAPPGGLKTELIKTLSGLSHVHPLSTLTSRTFVSGQKKTGQETSLLLKITNGIITFEDFTTLLSENKDERGAIMGQLRAIYGGKFDKTFGTGETVSWEGKITVIAGATYAIHSLRELYASMGERFLMYNMIQPDRVDAARRTMENQESGKMKEMRAKVQQAVHHYLLDEFKLPEKMPKIKHALREELLEIAELATRARSAVEREWRSPNKEITETYPPEMPTRFAAQLQTVAMALMCINFNDTGKADLLPSDHEILYKLDLDSITKSKRRVLVVLAQYDVIETAGLGIKTNFPTGTVRRWCEDLNALEVIDRAKGGGRSDKWSLKPKYREMIQKFEHVKTEGEELTEEIAKAEGGTVVEEESANEAFDNF